MVSNHAMFLMLASVCRHSSEVKVHVDGCRHWLQIGIGIALLQTKGGYSLQGLLSYVNHYLSNSQMPADR